MLAALRGLSAARGRGAANFIAAAAACRSSPPPPPPHPPILLPRFKDSDSRYVWIVASRNVHTGSSQSLSPAAEAAIEAEENVAEGKEKQEEEAEKKSPFAIKFGFSEVFAKKHCPQLLKPEGAERLGPVFEKLKTYEVEEKRLKALFKNKAGASALCRCEGTEVMEKNLGILTKYGLNESQIRETVRKHPAILVIPLEFTVRFLIEQGFSAAALSAILSKAPATMSCDTFKHLTPRIALLAKYSIGRHLLSKCVVKHPKLLNYSEKKIRAVLEALSSRLPQGLAKHVVGYDPSIVCCEAEKIDELIDAFCYIGFKWDNEQVQAWAQSLSWGSRHGVEAVRDKIDFLMSLGLRYRTIAMILKKEPHVFKVDNSVLKAKIEFFTNEMKFSPEDLVRMPSYLSRKVMDRVKIRFQVLSLLKNRGIIAHIHLPDLVTLPKKWFVETFVFKYPDCGRIYYGGRSAVKQARAMAKGEKVVSFY